MKPHYQNAFTLLELLIAIAIFSLISIMAFSGLNTILFNKTMIDGDLDRLTNIQRTMLHLSRDIEQAILRPTRNELGSTQAAFSGGQNIDSTLFEFSRAGWRNPTHINRAEIQRVAYSFEDDQLIRLYWPQLDHLSNAETRRKTLLDNVKQIEVRYFDNNWHSSWPPISSSTTSANATLPLAIEITIELGDWGTIKRLFRLPA